MTKPQAILAAVILSIGSISPVWADQQSLQGDWLGQIDFGASWARINMHFTTENSEVKGTVDLPGQDRKGLPVKKVVHNAKQVRIEWQDGTQAVTLDGRVENQVFTGNYQQDSTKGTFRLIRVAKSVADLKLSNQYAGSYRLAADRFIDIAPFSEDEDRPIFFDSKTRRTGVLYAISDTEFFTGPSYGVLFPIDIRVAIIKNERGEVTGLAWQQGDEHPQFAERVAPYVQHEISFRNGDVVLRGTLTLPASKGPHPVVIQVHGSGPAQRPGGHWTHFFVRHGIGYLYFDKRGCGASTGDWSKASLHDLAGDALAAVDALRSRPDVNPRQVGLWGNSNGGWVAPLAASRSKAVAFLIVRSGSALSVHENILFELEMDLRAAGKFTDADIAKARQLRKQMNAALLTNTGWDALRAAVDKAKDETWFPYARVQWLPLIKPPLDSELHPYLKGLRMQIDFDPTPVWEKVTCPVLILLGELDAHVPSAASAVAFERGLTKADNGDVSIRVLPKANHGLFEAKTGFRTEAPRLKHYAAGYMDGMVDWLRKRVDVKP